MQIEVPFRFMHAACSPKVEDDGKWQQLQIAFLGLHRRHSYKSQLLLSVHSPKNGKWLLHSCIQEAYLFTSPLTQLRVLMAKPQESSLMVG